MIDLFIPVSQYKPSLETSIQIFLLLQKKIHCMMLKDMRHSRTKSLQYTDKSRTKGLLSCLIP
ncbi:hypothetical protein IGI04_031947 [Brassica rapa subsp. trilocularis]|uniref:Uncharacterized protein n=1 Tax=Brassica rapa subsp. trilocularis TaxID=1813537 RepID=A0ABQ7LV17_BRACM|nr:hypothetical protein IGI04_031947 [Brassica rapa subsp. trilocularis]